MSKTHQGWLEATTGGFEYPGQRGNTPDSFLYPKRIVIPRTTSGYKNKGEEPILAVHFRYKSLSAMRQK